ncbi:hypothetical protein [Litoribrevibacter albus]|uniref:Uncharacterized protein n=1 Tax=Litoribrevibacter albus TaxID=1473156 RepID=A0AA37W6G6_9GAMM|nr:hypothetical protein [Litoribrevibacter albus]GLQ31630.1 hypothetical protein GCM10007876_21090 [Litoribrevibacter albus]
MSKQQKNWQNTFTNLTNTVKKYSIIRVVKDRRFFKPNKAEKKRLARHYQELARQLQQEADQLHATENSG